MIGEAGIAVAGTAEAFAEGVSQLLQRPRDEWRTLSRARAERYGWPRAVEGFLHAHGAEVAPSLIRPAVPRPRPMAPPTREPGADEAGAPRYA